MNKSRIILFLSAVGICLIGVGAGVYLNGASQTTNAVNVAVIDLDEVARRVGRDAKMNSSIQQRQELLNQQLVTIRRSFENELLARKNAIGTDPTDEQSQELLQLRRDADLKMNEANRQARANLKQHQGELINSFREDTRAALNPLAKEQGIMLIVSKNDTVIFNYESALDITNQVVERMVAISSSAVDSDAPDAPEQIAARPSNNSSTQ